MVIYQPRMVSHGISQRLSELLDAIKQEFENLSQEASLFRYHKDDFEHKINSQIQEMQIIQKSICDLEATHRKIKHDYEEEICRLRAELENHDQDLLSSRAKHNHQSNSRSQSLLPQSSHHPIHLMGEFALPSISMAQNNAFGNIITGHQLPSSHTQATPQQNANSSSSEAVQNHHLPYVNANNTFHVNDNLDQQIPIQPHPSKRSKSEESNNTQASPGKHLLPSISSQKPTLSQKPIPRSQGDIKSDSRSAEINYDRVAPEYIVDHEDWSVTYNPLISRNLEIKLLHTFEPKSVVCCVRFSFDGKLLAAGCNKAAVIYEISSGQKVAFLQYETQERERDLYIRSVAFSPDNDLLATGAEDKQIRVWDISKNTVRNLFVGHEQAIYSLDYSKNGRYIASGSGDGTARIWDMETNLCVLILSIEDGVTTIAFSPDCQYVAAGSLDKIVRVWSINGELLERLEGHEDSVYAVAFSPNSKMLLSGSLDKTVKFWNLQDLKSGHNAQISQNTYCTSFIGHKDYVLSVGMSVDGLWVVSGSKDHGVQFWDPNTARSHLVLHGHKNSVISVCLSPVSNVFATGSGDFRARVWSYETSK